MARRRILFIYPWQDTTFIRKDELILSQHFDLKVLRFERKPSFYRELHRILSRREVDTAFLWFLLPDYAALTLWMCRRYGIKFVLVTGGYDVACMPEIRFGNMRKPHHRLIGGWVIRNADLLLPFSNWAGEEARRWAVPRGRVVTVYPGIDTGAFTPPAAGARRSGVVTVGTVNPLFNVQKGLLTFARVSRLMPEVPYRIVGKIGDEGAAAQLRAAGGPNLELLGRRVSDEELRDLYRTSSVYAQLSAHEGFGIAVAEAMACGSIPVVCSGTASPEVVGECGEIAAFGDVEASAGAIRRALAAGPARRLAARERVEALFRDELRPMKLLELL